MEEQPQQAHRCSSQHEGYASSLQLILLWTYELEADCKDMLVKEALNCMFDPLLQHRVHYTPCAREF